MARDKVRCRHEMHTFMVCVTAVAVAGVGPRSRDRIEHLSSGWRVSRLLHLPVVCATATGRALSRDQGEGEGGEGGEVETREGRS